MTTTIQELTSQEVEQILEQQRQFFRSGQQDRQKLELHI